MLHSPITHPIGESSMSHRNVTRRRHSLIVAAVGLALCLAIPGAAKPPSWDKRIDGKARFKVLKALDSEAVLDKETGLVWQQAAATEREFWVAAKIYCLSAATGGRGGWRLPRVEELGTLLTPGTGLPSAHPFDASGDLYWTATARTDFAWGIATIDGSSELVPKVALTLNGVWCVRGGAGLDEL